MTCNPIADLIDENIVVTGQIAPGKQEKSHTQASYGAHFCEVKDRKSTRLNSSHRT